MSRRHDNASSDFPTYGKYKFVCATTECTNPNEAQASYGVQFTWRPTREQLKGGGHFWKGHVPLQPESSLTGLRALAAKPATTSDDDDDNNDDDDDNNNNKAGPSSNAQNGADRDTVMHDAPHASMLASGGAAAAAKQEFEPIALESKSDVPFRNLFVTCNGNATRIYEARKGRAPKLLQLFEDEDPEEMYYCVCWTYNANSKNEWWVCASGKKGVVRVINISQGELIRSLVGHGEAINDIKVHPRDPALLLTASKDESLRLWNLRTGVTVAVFSGLKGHRGEVVHADFSIDGSKFASCGIDNSIRIWDVYADDSVVAAIKESHYIADQDRDGDLQDSYVYKDDTGTRKKFKVPITQFPFFVTRKVHKHYVDCVMWVGELLLSKSVHNRMFLWSPESERDSLASPACNYTLLDEYILDACNVWFIRFAIDRSRRLVACGNEKGVVSVFNLSQIPSKGGAGLTIGPKDKHKYTSQFVRQCAFSEDGSILLAVDDTASVVQYELIDGMTH